MKERLKELTASPKMNPLTKDQVIIQISKIAPPMMQYKKKIITDPLVGLNYHAILQYNIKIKKRENIKKEKRIEVKETK